MNKVISLIELKPRLRAARIGKASWRLHLWDALRIKAGSIANRLGFPAIIKQAEICDDVTGRKLCVTTHPLFTVVSVDGRDYYFRRFTGKYNGAGLGCS